MTSLGALRLRIAGAVLACAAAVIGCSVLVMERRPALMTESARRTDAADAGRELMRLQERTADADLLLPLPGDVHFEDIAFESFYLDCALQVKVRTREKAFYEDTPVPCDASKVTGIFLQEEEGGLSLTASFDRLYEYELAVSEAQVVVRLKSPREVSGDVVIVDPVYSGAGSDVALQLAKKLQEIGRGEGGRLRIYLTRTDAAAADPADVLRLAEAAQAQRFLRLQMPEGEADMSVSASYYDGFYIRGYGNARFASDLETAMAQVAGMRVQTPEPVKEEAALKQMKIPAAALRIEGIRSAYGSDDALLEEIARVLCESLCAGLL